MPRLFSLLCLMLVGLGTHVHADEIVLRFGVDDVENNTNTRTGVVYGEYFFDPFWKREKFAASLGIAASIDGDGDFYAAAGVRGVLDLNDKWFAEGSFMAGYFDQGTGGTPLSYDLEFRSLLGINYRLTDRSHIGLSVAHISNADLGRINPGTNQVMLNYGFGF